MNNLSLRKYFGKCILYGGLFLVCVAFVFLNMSLPISKQLTGILFAVMAIVLASRLFKTVAKLMKLKKVCASLEIKEGIVTNWSLIAHYRFRTDASVSIKEDMLEYVSDSIFSATDAEDLVGKKVKYAVHENELIIYEIL